MNELPTIDTLIIGAGPAGLAAAHQLQVYGVRSLVLEADPQYVGGLARTVHYKGNRFDIGGHRFFTRSPRVQQFWSEILGEQMISRPRRSRILYRGQHLTYPLQLRDVSRKLGYRFLLSACASWAWAQLFASKSDENFEQWIIRRFGAKIYRCFFKSYTEKVWGIPCNEISADWAAQRINSLSVPTLVYSMFRSNGASLAKTLIDQFHYPRLGPGQLWELVAEKIDSGTSQVRMDQKVISIEQTTTGYKVETQNSDRVEQHYEASTIISTMPLRELCQILKPLPPPSVQAAAAALRYRDFIAVALILDCPSPFNDQWLYIHEPNVKVGRIQNMQNWSEALVANPSTTVLLFEYFCSEVDPLWKQRDEYILALAQKELQTLALAPGATLLDGTVLRAPKAYPLYDADYQTHVEHIRKYLAETHPKLQTVGRNGMHRYNNQDHAILTGFIAADSILDKDSSDSAWYINQDAQHIEERLHPQRVEKQE